MKQLNKKIIESCKKRLQETKAAHLQKLKELSAELVAEASGDVADQARKLQEETMSIARQRKIETELYEIDEALNRIANNTFGICEETENPIEEKRLQAIPWTRLSLEGAEIREMEREEQEIAG